MFFSGEVDLSCIDPVVVGRGVFNVTNGFVCGVGSYIRDVLCALLDTILDVVKGIHCPRLPSL